TAFRSRWALFGAAAIFLYVGAEVSIGSAMTNFLHEPDMLNISLEEAGKMVSFYWGGAMVGRFIGSGLLFLVKQREPWVLANPGSGHGPRRVTRKSSPLPLKRPTMAPPQ